MAELEQGTIIKLLNGKTCTVDSELGRGGQGIVYLVDYCGGDFALKWYTRDYSDSFYNNLKRNADSGAPSNAFLWPLAVTEKQKGSFGYIMKLRPRGYREFSDFMLAKVQFSSMAANINAAIKICDAFQKLHIRGLSYQDMNDGNFFINPRNGDVLICDNDNVAPDKTNLGIIGKAGYLAPEIVDQKTMPNRYSDYFSMAVILFILFYFNRPFEGKKIVTLEGMQREAQEFGSFLANEGAEQCGFCNPGFIMNVFAMLNEIKDPTEEQIKEYLAGNLCRCSGFVSQTRSILKFLKYKKAQEEA